MGEALSYCFDGHRPLGLSLGWMGAVGDDCQSAENCACVRVVGCSKRTGASDCI